MAHTISVRTYVVVCALLVLLTVLTVGVSFWPVPPVWHTVLGLGIALCKGTLVVLVFMHVVISPRQVWIVIAVASFWLGILVVLTLTDYVTRGMVPAATGH